MQKFCLVLQTHWHHCTSCSPNINHGVGEQIRQLHSRRAKSQLTSDVLLVHFDPSKEIALSCDASPYGIGAVLSHLQEDGSDRPIAYASRSLTPAEKNYSQIGLAVVWGVKKFHPFLFGR